MMETEKEVNLNKILTYLANSSTKEVGIQKDIMKCWNTYVNISYGLEDIKMQEEIDMQATYEKYRNVFPTMEIGEGGGIIVRGLR